MHSRQLPAALTPAATSQPNTTGMTFCVNPPPMLPHPPVMALAVPTTFGANIIDVWYCVITNDAPITPMHSRATRNPVKLCASPTHMTGTDPTASRTVYDSRGPIASHSRPNPSPGEERDGHRRDAGPLHLVGRQLHLRPDSWA